MSKTFLYVDRKYIIQKFYIIHTNSMKAHIFQLRKSFVLISNIFQHFNQISEFESFCFNSIDSLPFYCFILQLSTSTLKQKYES